MPVTVTTGGPSMPLSDPTLGSLMAIIADEIDDTTGEYTTQIKNSILAAIRYCERSNYYFNETRDETFTTVSGQEWYGRDDNEHIPALIGAAVLYSENASGQRSVLRRVTPSDMEEMSDNTASRGEPTSWTYFGQRIRLYPIPGDTIYTIRMQLGPYRLATLSTINDSNAWLTEGADMIKARAKYILAKDYLRDPAMAMEALSDYQDQDGALARETSARVGTGYIRPTCF